MGRGVIGRCADPSCKAPDSRLLRYLNNTVCAFGTCQAYATEQVAARRSATASAAAGQPVGPMEQCFHLEQILGVRECEPTELSVPKRRAEELDEDDQAISYEVRGQFGMDETDAQRAGFDTRWVRLTDLIKTIEYEALDDALSKYELSVHHRMKRARVDAYNRQWLESSA